MIAPSAFEGDRVPTLVWLAESCQASSDEPDPSVSSATCEARYLFEGTPKHGNGEG
jgi:hypothetical protein